MSLKYAEKFGGKIVSREQLREFLKGPKPERDKNGKIVYVTEQAHKDRCDINAVVKRYAKTGVIDHVSSFEASYGDLSGKDFKEMMDTVVGVGRKFGEFPLDVRKRFHNDPAEFLAFFDNPGNRDEAIKLGLIRNDWTVDSDGLGEKVKKGENKVQVPEAGPPSP